MLMVHLLWPAAACIQTRGGGPFANWAPVIWKLTLKVQHSQGSTHVNWSETIYHLLKHALMQSAILWHLPWPYAQPPLCIQTLPTHNCNILFLHFSQNNNNKKTNKQKKKKKNNFSNWKYAKCSSGVRQHVCRACTQWLIHVSPIKDKSHMVCFTLK